MTRDLFRDLKRELKRFVLVNLSALRMQTWIQTNPDLRERAKEIWTSDRPFATKLTLIQAEALEEGNARFFSREHLGPLLGPQVASVVPPYPAPNRAARRRRRDLAAHTNPKAQCKQCGGILERMNDMVSPFYQCAANHAVVRGRPLANGQWQVLSGAHLDKRRDKAIRPMTPKDSDFPFTLG